MLKAMRRGRGGSVDRERGAALVEFALLFPVFMTLILGMFTGGIAYNQDLSINHAAREGARYGATLAKQPGGLGATDWTNAVINRVVEAAAGDIEAPPAKPSWTAGHFVCVALVTSNGTTVFADSSGSYFKTAGFPPSPAPPNYCYPDNLTDPNPRVHVMVGRPGQIRTVVFTKNLNLNSRGIARYEDR